MGWLLFIIGIIYALYRIFMNSEAANNYHVGNNGANRPNNAGNRPAYAPMAEARYQQDTGMMVYYANDPHNLSDNEYRFSFRKIGSGWRAYILKSPTLNGRAATCHRLSDDGGMYICWDSTIPTLRDMQNVARQWADNSQKYIATGVGF